MKKVLIVAEFDAQNLKPSVAAVVTAARLWLADGQAQAQAQGQVELVLIGEHSAAAAEQAARLQGVDVVQVWQAPTAQAALPEQAGAWLAAQASGYQAVFMAASAWGKTLLPRLAGLLDVAMVSDVTRIVDSHTLVRPIYAGNLNATVALHEAISLISVRPSCFAAAATGTTAAPIQTTVVAAVAPEVSEFLGQTLAQSDRPELTQARVVVSGGRSLGSAERFQSLLLPLAEQLHAAVGATRAAVDAGYAPNEWQVGQTGTVVAPELYLAIGVAGAAQHVAGIKDSRVIVAINHDPDAAIFQWADYGLVADLFDAVTELRAALPH